MQVQASFLNVKNANYENHFLCKLIQIDALVSKPFISYIFSPILQLNCN